MWAWMVLDVAHSCLRLQLQCDADMDEQNCLRHQLLFSSFCDITGRCKKKSRANTMSRITIDSIQHWFYLIDLLDCSRPINSTFVNYISASMKNLFFYHFHRFYFLHFLHSFSSRWVLRQHRAFPSGDQWVQSGGASDSEMEAVQQRGDPGLSQQGTLV